MMIVVSNPYWSSDKSGNERSCNQSHGSRSQRGNESREQSQASVFLFMGGERDE